MRALAALAAIFVSSPALAWTLPPALTPRQPIGSNINGVTYYSSAIPFTDLMREGSYSWAGSASITDIYDDNGWLTRMPENSPEHVLILTGRSSGGRLPTGTWHARWRGTATFQGYTPTVLPDGTKAFDQEVTTPFGNSGPWIRLTSMDPNDHMTGFRYVMPGGICQGDPFTRVTSQAECGAAPYLEFVDHPELLWNPDFLRSMRGYSVVRMMDWMRTNNNPESEWIERTPMSYATWGRDQKPEQSIGPDGVPWEAQIDLCNVLKVICWINVPTKATDDYAQHLAELIRDRLDPSLGIFLEWSNETWNSIFMSFTWRQELAQARGIDGPQMTAVRTRELGKIFEGVLGDDRVLVIYSAQRANPWTFTHGMEYLDAHFPGDTGIEAVAVTTYYGQGITPEQKAAPPWSTMDTDGAFAWFFDATRINDYVNNPNKGAKAWKALADARDIPLLSYEGGLSLLGISGAVGSGGDDWNNWLSDGVARDPRMRDYTRTMVKANLDNGFILHMQYVDTAYWTLWGRWGAQEYLDDPPERAPEKTELNALIDEYTNGPPPPGTAPAAPVLLSPETP